MTPEEEERGWEAVRARWGDEEAHRTWLAGFTDLEGLARAGQRYRAHLAQNAGDPVAERWLKEIVKRATVHGLASLPRTRPPAEVPRWVKRAGVALLSSVLAYLLYWLAQQLSALSWGR